MPPKRDTETAPMPPEIITSFRPESASPDDIEKLIDYRIERIDEEMAEHRAMLENLAAEKKRWLGVSGGRSRIPTAAPENG